MSKAKLIEYTACDDCRLYIANDELPPDTSDERDAQIIAGFNHQQNEHGVLLCVDTEAASPLYEFSSCICGVCGTNEAGARYRVNGIGAKITWESRA